MPRVRQDPNESYARLREFLTYRPRTGETPSNIPVNEYAASIEPTFEQEREGNVLADMDKRYAASREAGRAAIQAGFPTSQAQAEYGRTQERRKMELPLIQSRERMESEERQAREIARAAEQSNRSFNVSGVGGVGAAPKPSTATPPMQRAFPADVQKRISGAQDRIRASRESRWSPLAGVFGRGEAGGQKLLEQEVTQAARQLGIPPERMQELTTNVVPKGRNMAERQAVLDKARDAGRINDQEWDEFSTLLRYISVE